MQHIGTIPRLVNRPLNPTFETGQNVNHHAVVTAVKRNNRADTIARSILPLVASLAQTRQPPTQRR